MKQRLLSIFLITSIIFPVFPLQAQTVPNSQNGLDAAFDPNFVLTDDDVFDSASWSRDRLQEFLLSKGTLGHYVTADIDGTQKYAADIIIRVANTYKVSPKFLVALMQKEQSLIEDPYPTQRQFDWATGFGVCDSCSKDDPAISDFKGFANQLDYAAKQMRERYYLRLLMNGQTNTGMSPGRTTIIDGIEITPVNFATAALYTYTPHIHGNQNLWTIWRRWFSKKFPNGTVVKGIPSGQVYWIRYGKKKPFASQTVAGTLVDLEKAVEVSDSELAGYEEGPQINFPNYALLRNPAGQIWLIVDDERRHIVNMETFGKFGFNMDEVEDVGDEDLASYAIGNKLTLDDQYPKGQLVQVTGLKAIWYAEGHTKQLIPNPTIWTLYFNGRRPRQITQEQLDSMTTLDPYGFKDGELVKHPESPAVYVMEYGKKRPIPSGDIFEELGWKWSSIETIPTSVLDAVPTGMPILLNEPETLLTVAS
ncbi:hypothetical protein KJZ71_01735 [Patescibacteria group bacterium]|uniref:Curculin domain protein (Mannose-binding) lectin n=1 Tax=candidate division WWE3 bacterium TaxID=2053526 RepID=A0A928Y6K2_UNCKA|nr:hypothetical protein [candidate division WWE3 bacterium]MCL4732508.1 hypothetical protein [Patescibacteria group bacterium]MDL1952584.1 hypothetical protein [Candidatus Uhrbacteria bacterium UHB]RIL01283.1 MAG: hypothetical protein DCC77_01955 [Candidatus Uhrbacteria bacterium]